MKPAASVDTTCRNCGSGATARAHIIPKAFAHAAREGEKHLICVARDDRDGSISQTGFIDQNILCASCDGRLGRDDKYAIEFCRRIEKQLLPNPETPAMRQYALSVRYDVDTRKLVRFANAVVFRASISKRPQFSEFKLPHIDERIRVGLFAGDTDNVHGLCDVFMVRYRMSQINPAKVYSYPYFADFEGMKLANFSLGGFRFMTRVGEGGVPPRYAQYLVNRAPFLSAPITDFQSTSEFGGMVQMVMPTPPSTTK